MGFRQETSKLHNVKWREVKQGKEEEEGADAIPFWQRPCRYVAEACSRPREQPVLRPQEASMRVMFE